MNFHDNLAYLSFITSGNAVFFEEASALQIKARLSYNNKILSCECDSFCQSYKTIGHSLCVHARTVWTSQTLLDTLITAIENMQIQNLTLPTSKTVTSLSVKVPMCLYLNITLFKRLHDCQ